MTDSDKYRLAALQLEIMDVLWRLGEATVAKVREEIAAAGNDLAYTTIATMLTKMEKKGVVSHRSEGRIFLYAPAVQRERVADVMTGELIDGVFEGSASKLVNHLLDSDQIAGEELERIKEMIRRKEAERDAGR